MTEVGELRRVRRRWARERRLYRLLEMLPGVLVWTTFLLVIVLAVFRPLWAIIFIVVFDLYWLIRVLYLLVYLLIAYRRFRRTVRVDWRRRLQTLPGWTRLYHLVIIPTSKESFTVLDSTFRAFARVDYPLPDRLLVVLAIEERDGERAEATAAKIREKYAGQFGLLLVTRHPAGVPGELAGKGSNAAYAAREAQRIIDARGIPYEDVVVSNFDSDTQPHPAYFSYLSYVYLTHPRPTRTSFQPIPLYHNNIWQAPAVTRVLSNATTFWLMTETLRPDRMFTFSSHSMSFRALVDVDFWQSDIVTDDSRIFAQCYIRYDGDYEVTPLYLPLSMDTVLGKSFVETLKSQYKQYRRWAYGVENFPYLVWNFVGNRAIPFRKKFKHIWNQLEGVYSWATTPIIIFVLGWLPLRFVSEEVSATALAQNAPIVISWLVRSAMVGLLLSAILATVLLPPRPPGKRRSVVAMMFFQWILFPFLMIVFGSVPATDAQTRLMLGKYLGFWVTPKGRKA